eukprot:scaffold38245_cov33-Tisochrysis_lutea.AAC.4
MATGLADRRGLKRQPHKTAIRCHSESLFILSSLSCCSLFCIGTDATCTSLNNTRYHGHGKLQEIRMSIVHAQLVATWRRVSNLVRCGEAQTGTTIGCNSDLTNR